MITASTLITAAALILADVRCYKCSKLLFKWERQGNAGISVKCPRCGQLDMIRLST